MSLTLLPEEIQRKIIIMCEKSNAVRNISITSKSFYSLGIQKHFIPKAIEYYFSLDDDDFEYQKENREAIYKGHIGFIERISRQMNVSPFVYYCIDILDNISQISGDYSIYDATHEYYRIKKSKYEYKTLGFMNLSEFDRLAHDDNDKLCNIWKNTKWCYVRQYFQNASLTLKALI